jgi:hypothetical protein
LLVTVTALSSISIPEKLPEFEVVTSLAFITAVSSGVAELVSTSILAGIVGGHEIPYATGAAFAQSFCLEQAACRAAASTYGCRHGTCANVHQLCCDPLEKNPGGFRE